MEGRAWLDDAQVLSEVHLECQPDDTSSLSRASSFTIRPPQTDSAPDEPPEIAEANEPDGIISGVDENGDLVVPRQRRRHLHPARSNHDIVLIYHHMATIIPRVGLQIWRGALLLADYILHKIYTSTDLQDVTAVELGAGTGLVGIVLARQAKLVFITDKDAEILDNCSRNVFANEDSFRYGEATVRVRELDWQQQPWPPEISTEIRRKGNEASYACSSEDLAELQDATVLLAADVIYSDDLTDAFFDILRRLMPAGSKKVLFLGLEKRYNFSMDDMDVVANGYANFLRYLNVEGKQAEFSREATEQRSSKGEADFMGRTLELSSIPKFIQEYDRGEDLELWEIRRCNVDKSQEIP